jgi:RHS repeat-associated protein
VRLLTDGAGAVTDRYSYSAFGSGTQTLGTDAQPYRFAGEPFEGRGLLSYNRARWMDPSLGMFVSVDPLLGRATVHGYRYAEQNPLNWIDPSGAIAVIPWALCPSYVSNMVFGNAVHNALYADFLANGTGSPMHRVTNRGVGTLLGYVGWARVFTEFFMRPDLAQVGEREIWEIKPNNPRGLEQGTLELLAYLEVLNHWSWGWTAGTGYNPKEIVVLGQSVDVRSEIPGLLLYCVTPTIEFGALGGVLAARITGVVLSNLSVLMSQVALASTQRVQ